MQSSPPQRDGKARAMRELSASLRHNTPRPTPSYSPPPSDSNPTKHSGFGSTSGLFNNEDVLASTQHHIDDTDALPQYSRMRSTAKKFKTWQMPRSEQPNPDTSMVNKEFGDFDHSRSDEEDVSIEQARGDHRSNRSTPGKISSRAFDSLYDITPPTARSRKSYAAETGSLRRDAQIRRASRNDVDMTASPRPASTRNSPALAVNPERKRTSLAQLHARVSEDESSFIEERPPTMTMNNTRSTRWGNPRSRQTSLQTDGVAEASPRVNAASRSRPATTQNATAQSFILPDLPNLTELVSGIFEDGTPVFSKTAAPRSRFAAPNRGGTGGRQPNHLPVDSVPIPQEEKAIFAALQLLQDKVAQMEHERAEADKKIEEQELELIELRATTQAQEKLRRSDSALGSTDGEGSGKGSWKVEKTRLDATVQTLRTKLDRTERKIAVIEIEKERLGSERDNMASQLGVAFQTCEELKVEKEALRAENEALRQEIDSLRADNDALHDQLEHEQAHHRDETIQLRRQLDQTENVTQRENITLQAELARAHAQHDEHTQQLARKDIELRKARQQQAEYARLKADHEALKSQLAGLKAKREEDRRRWSNEEAALKARVERREETIRHLEDVPQEQTNDAIRLDNENLRQELTHLATQLEEDNERWARKERELKRKIAQREGVVDMTREILSIRQANGQQTSIPAPASADKENGVEEPIQRKPSYRREDTRTRIKNRIQEEVRNSRANASFQSSHIESPRKSYTGISRTSHRASLPADLSRSVSAPVSQKKNTEVGSDVESTTDLSLAPRRTPYVMRGGVSGQPACTPIQPPIDLDYTELSFIDSNQIAQLRRQLEEERAAARNRASSVPLERTTRDDTVRSQRQGREDTVRSVASAKSNRQPSLPRKSSLKDITKTNLTRFEEDFTGNVSNAEAANVEATQTKESAIDTSMLSNTSRRRRSAPTEMTSAFIVPDIKIDASKQTTTRIELSQQITSMHHDSNCTVCRREKENASDDPLRVPKLIPVSSRTADDVDATLRPARSPKEALALVVKELRDERAHLHIELAIVRAMFEAHDPSKGARKHDDMLQGIQELVDKIAAKDKQIYNLYDVLEEQQDHDLTEQDVEEHAERIRAENAELEKKTREKKVTIQSFVGSEDQHSARFSADGDEEELPWEGFEDTEERNFTGDASARVSMY